MSQLSSVQNTRFRPVTFGQIAAQPEINQSLEKSGYKTVADVFKAAKDNYLDSGTDNVFFHIPNNTDYLLGMPTESNLWKKLEKQTPEDVFGDSVFVAVNKYPQFQLGQTLSQIDDLRLHKRISGFPHGVRRSQLELHDEKAYRAYEPKAYEAYKSSLEKASEFPQAAYTSLAKFLKRLQSASPPIYFDPGANNLMVDVQRKRFRVIDPSEENDVLIHHCEGNNIAGMTAALLDTPWVLTQKEHYKGGLPLAETDKHLQNLRRSILEKSLLAGYDAGLPHERNPFPVDSAFYKSHDLAYAFRSAGMTDADCSKALGAFNKTEGRKLIEQVFSK